MSSLFRRLFFFLVTLLGLLFLFLALLPSILSSDWGRQQAIALLNQSISGKVEIKQLQLGWKSGLSIKEFSLKDAKGNLVIFFDELSTEASLLDLLSTKRLVGLSEIKNLNLFVVADSNAKTNLQNTLPTFLPQNPIGNLAPITLSQLFAKSNESTSTPTIQVEITGKTSQASLNGSFSLLAHFPKFEQNDKTLTKYLENELTAITANIENFPTDLLDLAALLTHSNAAHSFHTIFGNYLSLSIQKPKNQQAAILAFNLQSPQIKGRMKGKIEDEQLSLLEPGIFALHLPKDLVNSFIQPQAKIKEALKAELSITRLAFSLSAPFSPCAPILDVSLEVFDNALFSSAASPLEFSFAKCVVSKPDCNSALKVTLSSQGVFDQHKFEIAKTFLFEEKDNGALLHFPSFALSWGDQKTRVKIEELALEVQKDENFHFGSNLRGKLSVIEKDALPSSLLGDPLFFSLNSSWHISSSNELHNNFIKFFCSNSTLQAHIQGQLDSSDLFRLTDPSTLDYRLSPAALVAVEKLVQKRFPEIATSIDLHFEFAPTELPLKRGLLSELFFQGSVVAKKIIFKSPLSDFPRIEDLTIGWEGDFKKKHLSIDVKGWTYETEESKPNKLSAHAQFWLPKTLSDWARTKSEVRLNFSGLPTALLDLFVQNAHLNVILGSILDVNLKAYFDPTHEKTGYLDAVIDSSRFHAEGRFSLDQAMTIYEGNKLPIIRLTVTQESYEKIQQIARFKDSRQLSSPFKINIKFDELTIPIQKDAALQSIFSAQLSTTNLEWKNQKETPWRLDGQLSKKTKSPHLVLELTATSESVLSLKGEITDFVDENRLLKPLRDWSINVQLDTPSSKTASLSDFLPLSADLTNSLNGLLGNSYALEAKMQQENQKGLLRIDLKGESGQITLDGNLSHGYLSLNSPFELKTVWTPLFIQTFLKTSFLKTVLPSKNTLHLSIEPSGFFCPLFPFSLNELLIEKGKLSLGVISLKNEGDVHALLRLLHIASPSFLSLAVTPIEFDVKKAKMSVQPFEILIADNYSFTCWGSLNLSNSEGDFVLGIPSKTIQQLFALSSLKEENIFQVPLKIKQGRLIIDKIQTANMLGQFFLGGGLRSIAPLEGSEPSETSQQSDSASNSTTATKQEKKSKKKDKSKKKNTKSTIEALKDSAKEWLNKQPLHL